MLDSVSCGMLVVSACIGTINSIILYGVYCKSVVDVILDVRTQSEWDNIGRIEGATLAENLGSFGSTTISGASPADFQGCEFCTIAVYCRK